MKYGKLMSILPAIFLMSSAVAVQYPDYYPSNYDELVIASKKEDGLVVYSNISDTNWHPLLEGFHKKYPWIKVETLDLGSGTVHTRWEAEVGSGARTADMLVSGANDRWARYTTEQAMLKYQSPELTKLPSFAQQKEGVYVMSTDPLVITYNAMLLSEKDRPTGFASLVKLTKQSPQKYKGKVTTYDPTRNSFGLASWWKFLSEKGDDAWQQLRVLAPMLRGETSGGLMNEKISTGEYLVGLGVSGITIFPKLDQPGGKVLGFSFPDDGTLVMSRGIGITKNTKNPNSAKLLLDFILSHEGQTLIGKGGLTPYREDVNEKEVRYTYQGIADIVGSNNMIVVDFDATLATQAENFIKKWNEVMNSK